MTPRRLVVVSHRGYKDSRSDARTQSALLPFGCTGIQRPENSGSIGEPKLVNILNPEDLLASSRVVQGEMVMPRRLWHAKTAYTTRFLAQRLANSLDGFFLSDGAAAPGSGDIVLASVVRVGQHPKLESPASRRQALYVGDEILVAYGNRYAPDQFLAKVPPTLDQCQLIAAGGVAGQVIGQHALMGAATELAPIGLLADDSGVLNLSRLAPHQLDATPFDASSPMHPRRRPPVLAVLGTSMNSGKTTVMSCLIKGLSAAGLIVSAGKATGTGSGNDPGMFADAGAAKVLDFTDFGVPTTFQLDHDRVRALFTGMVNALTDSNTDVIVLEVADGVYQGETRLLLADPVFRTIVDRVLFTAVDALGATAGLQLLRAADLRVAAVSGLLTSSPLAVQEASAAIDAPVLGTLSLCTPSVAVGMLPRSGEEPPASST